MGDLVPRRLKLHKRHVADGRAKATGEMGLDDDDDDDEWRTARPRTGCCRT